MFSKSFPALALVAALFSSSAHADQTFATGGLVLDLTADITIAKEEVYLSIREVRVHYEYDSTTAQSVAMGFPMPIVPIDFGPDHLGGFVAEEGDVHTNYTGVRIKVGDQEIAPTAREFAYFNGVDITNELTALGIPAYIGGGDLEPALAGVDAAKIAELVQREIIFLDSYGDPQTANWQYQSVLEWTQDFAAGVTEVDISYRPLNGYMGDVHPQYFGEGEEVYVTAARGTYCIDDALLKALNKKRAAGSSFELIWLHFAPSAGEAARPGQGLLAGRRQARCGGLERRLGLCRVLPSRFQKDRSDAVRVDGERLHAARFQCRLLRRHGRLARLSGQKENPGRSRGLLPSQREGLNGVRRVTAKPGRVRPQEPAQRPERA